MATKLIVTKKVIGEMYIPAIEKQVLVAGHKFVVEDSVLDDYNVQMAISGGYLSIYEEKEKVADKQSVEKTVEKKSKVKKVEELQIETTDMNANEPKTNIASWDVENKKLINKEESSKAVREQYNGVEQSLQTGDIDFDKEVELPKVQKPKKRGRKSSLKDSIKSLEKVSEELENDIAQTNSSDISFVDLEQKAESIKSHPILGKKTE